MEIAVKTLTGEIIRVDVEGSNSIFEVKKMIEAKDQSYKPDQFKLSYSGKSLEDSKSVADYNIQRESVINIVRFNFSSWDESIETIFFLSIFTRLR